MPPATVGEGVVGMRI